MISAVIPTYRNPAYLDLCLKSAVENKTRDDTEIIVVVDGFFGESKAIIEKYAGISAIPLSQNMGMQYALNIGVINAPTKFVFILNDDNVFGPRWDQKALQAILGMKEPENAAVTINQVEPTPGIYHFIVKDLGRTAAEFRYEEWLAFEPTLENPVYTDAGRIFPFVISKRWYMAVGGFDTFYKSPFWCDCDFWLKLELTKQIEFKRCFNAHLYHFGSVATKNRPDAEAKSFKKSEWAAAQTFQYKWGYLPNLVEAAQQGNSKLPLDKTVNGITFRE